MKPTSDAFTENSRDALANETLQGALAKLSKGFPLKRFNAVTRLDEFDDIRDAGRDIKTDVLNNLDTYLEQFEAQVIKQGGKVHWARTADEACEIIVGLCKDAGARAVTKSKSMIGEEIAINESLENAGIEPIETDLGEYIIQLRKEPPSHIIAPAIHLTKGQVAETFKETHQHLPADRSLEEPRVLLDEARQILRQRFIDADVGITGANMLVAETGSIVVVTNEGNADLTMTLPKTHIAVASLEKIVPTLEDVTTLLRLLARSATGQDMSVYTTVVTGPKRDADQDGPEEFHIVLLDNGRTGMLGGDFHEMLRCIRCGACLNHCPIYKSVGGHAYGWVYSGPMGSVLIPNLLGIGKTGDLPNASTLCGKCEEVCPVRIPLPDMLRQWRTRQFEASATSTKSRLGIKLWAYCAKRPLLYRFVISFTLSNLRKLGFLIGREGRFKWLPFAGGWTKIRDFPAPEGKTFIHQYMMSLRGKR
jgi:L-lactate dehydrogenase complex protein LldF